ncbi:ribonuclease 1-like [Musa acuminata AAA Group]|uniref:ribonuclease 1-like n=1 Tax=Musa acuminata AAA Group TaxID=214697 RepID=UPI0031D35107
MKYRHCDGKLVLKVTDNREPWRNVDLSLFSSLCNLLPFRGEAFRRAQKPNSLKHDITCPPFFAGFLHHCFLAGFLHHCYVQLLVLQWPGSFCNVNRCCPMSTGYPEIFFTIYGLWLAFRNGMFPSCDKNMPSASKYNRRKMDPLIGEMIQHWHSFRCPSSDGHSFWQHEWDKHGTCSFSTFDQLSYFTAALNLKKKVDILSWLKAEGIFPDNNKYESKLVFQYLRREIGYKPAIQCIIKSGKQ